MLVEAVERSLECVRNERIVLSIGSRQCPKPAGWDIHKQDCIPASGKYVNT